jgi:ABC-2 type transport system ATP-binding protein
MSAHEMHTIEEFCSNVVILNRGKTVLKGNLKEIKNSYSANRISIETKKDITKIIKSNKLVIENSVDNKYLIKIDNEDVAHKLLKDLIKNNIEVIKFEIMKPTLNDIFIEKVGGNNE